jgi:hypothetical protein
VVLAVVAVAAPPAGRRFAEEAVREARSLVKLLAAGDRT